jgi:hypothetical protein
MMQEKWFLRIGGDDGETFCFETQEPMMRIVQYLVNLKETNGKLNKDDRGYNK